MEPRTSYRKPPPLTDPRCAWCGDPFDDDEQPVYDERPEWGNVGMPVHEGCRS